MHLYARCRDGFRLIDTVDAHEGPVTAVRFLGNGTLATCGADGRLCVWGLPGCEGRGRLELLGLERTEDGTALFDVAGEPSGQYALTGEGGGGVGLWWSGVAMK